MADSILSPALDLAIDRILHDRTLTEQERNDAVRAAVAEIMGA